MTSQLFYLTLNKVSCCSVPSTNLHAHGMLYYKGPWDNILSNKYWPTRLPYRYPPLQSAKPFSGLTPGKLLATCLVAGLVNRCKQFKGYRITLRNVLGDLQMSRPNLTHYYFVMQTLVDRAFWKLPCSDDRDSTF